jgi:hypothetical protein
MGRKTALLVLALSALCCVVGAAEDGEADFTAMRTVGRWLSDRGPFDPRPYEDVLIGNGTLDQRYFDFKNRLWAEKGVSFGGYFSVNIQWGSEGGSAHSISETLFLLTWEPVRKADRASRLVAGVAYDLTFGRPTTREFADRQRLVETPNDLDTDPDLTFATLGLLHWEYERHTGADRGWGLRAGQLYAPSYFGPARYLDDDRRFFMARPLAAAAGAQWVGYNDIGLGVYGIAWKNPLYVSAAVVDGKANRKLPDFESLADWQMLYLAEFGYEHDVDGPNEAALRLTISHLDVRDGEGPEAGPGQSVMLSGDKHFNGRWAMAGRYSRSFERLSADYRELGSLCFLWLSPLAREQDIAGLGFFAGDPSDPARGTESGFEVFYRLKLTQAVSIMPDLQYWSREDDEGEGTSAWVLGIRAEFDF